MVSSRWYRAETGDSRGRVNGFRPRVGRISLRWSFSALGAFRGSGESSRPQGVFARRFLGAPFKALRFPGNFFRPKGSWGSENQVGRGSFGPFRLRDGGDNFGFHGVNKMAFEGFRRKPTSVNVLISQIDPGGFRPPMSRISRSEVCLMCVFLSAY
jgi:hypothetical protein